MRIFTRDKSFYRMFFRLMLFIALQNLLSYSVALIDNAMLSRHSTLELNGAALANQVQFLLQMIVTAAGEGVVVLSAQYWGEKRTGPILSVASIGLITGTVFGLLFFALTSLMPGSILGLLSNDEDIIDKGCEYLSIIRFTYPIWCLSTVLLACQRSVENARIGFIVMLSSLFVNLFFNYCLIYGNLGFRDMGIQGAAIATLIARAFELIVALSYSWFKDKKLRLTPRRMLSYDARLWKDYGKYATPIMLGGASWGIAMFIQTSIIGHMPGDVISANTLSLNVFSVISVFAYGGGNAAGVITGKLIGENNPKLKEYVRTMQGLFLMTGLVTGALIFAVRIPVIQLFKLETPEAIRYAKQFMLVLSITSIGTAYQVACLTGIVRGGGLTKFVFYNDLIFQWGIILPLSLLAAYVWKLPPVWVFFILKSDQLLKCAVAAVEVNRYTWIRKLTQKQNEKTA
ncbi:MAG: MATE family efflux transporter [Clostridia bacterium]|nr:MATE family efflux transporter [Clostridia bacterium]